MMMGMMTSGILGPFANYFVPLMIGARRMAFPRIEALTFWLLMAAGTILMMSFVFGGFPTGWTGYAPLNEQANMGMDAYIAFFALVGLSMTLLGLNMLVTVITMRAPGMTFGPPADLRLGGHQHLGPDAAGGAGPDLDAADARSWTGRRRRASSTIKLGGSPYLYENLFWFFGHPEVYILALPGMGILLEILPGVLAQAALGLPPRGDRHARHRALQLPRLAAPPVRERHQRGRAPLLHALDRDHLAADGLHLHLRARDALEGADPLHRADALRARLALQLPDRRSVGRLPVGRAERRDHPRQLLLDGALPLHDHGRPAVRVLRRHLLLGAEDDRATTSTSASASGTSGSCSSPSTRPSGRCS